jgi:hypothetical protein
LQHFTASKNRPNRRTGSGSRKALAAAITLFRTGFARVLGRDVTGHSPVFPRLAPVPPLGAASHLLRRGGDWCGLWDSGAFVGCSGRRDGLAQRRKGLGLDHATVYSCAGLFDYGFGGFAAKACLKTSDIWQRTGHQHQKRDEDQASHITSNSLRDQARSPSVAQARIMSDTESS